METITIPVDPAIAKAYREADPEKQQKIATIVNDWLKSIIQEKQEKSLEQIIEEMQYQAKANGLNQEILEQILAE
ncbi:MAG: hypothetical protein Fur0025_11420 [Oscillatoriaceae cyanobacterium]